MATISDYPGGGQIISGFGMENYVGNNPPPDWIKNFMPGSTTPYYAPPTTTTNQTGTPSWVPPSPSWLNDPNNNPNNYTQGGQMPGWNPGWVDIANPTVPTNWEIGTDPSIIAANKAITDKYGDPWSFEGGASSGGVQSMLMQRILNPGWHYGKPTSGSGGLLYDEGTDYLYYDQNYKQATPSPSPQPSPSPTPSPQPSPAPSPNPFPSPAPTQQPTQQSTTSSPSQYWQNMFGPFSGYNTSFASPWAQQQSQPINYKSPFATDFIKPEQSSFVNPFGN